MRERSDPVVICGYARTPIGAFQGALAGVSSTALGAVAIEAAVRRAGLDPERVDQVIMGCVLAAGLGQAPARQAALGAGLPLQVQATTVNKMCGSGLQATILAHDTLRADAAQVIVAGGMESMSNAPYLLAKHRTGARLGHGTIADSLFLDGLEDAYEPGRLMGAFADDVARAHRIGRPAQDAFALASLTKARAAIDCGAFTREIAPVEVKSRRGIEIVTVDEGPAKADPAKISKLGPAFAVDGTITAANASSISDGAAALVLARQSTAQAYGLPILARIAAYGGHARTPGEFATAPEPAIRQALDRAGWSVGDVDLFEINEAFAIVTMLAAHGLAIPDAKLNVHGGACALGHPIGASGARILVTLLSALEFGGGRRGVAALCIGGGEALTIAVERTD